MKDDLASITNPLTTKSDLDLISAVLHNDVEAFSELINRYQNAVYCQAYWLLGDVQEAEDAAQEAFFRAYKKINTFNGSSFRAWILKITTNYCLDQIRRFRLHPCETFINLIDPEKDEYENESWLRDRYPLPEEILENSELTATIHRALLKLSPKYRLPIILVDLQEMNYEEATTFLKTNPGTFKSRLSRGRLKLASAIQEKGLKEWSYA